MDSQQIEIKEGCREFCRFMFGGQAGVVQKDFDQQFDEIYNDFLEHNKAIDSFINSEIKKTFFPKLKNEELDKLFDY